MSIELTEHQQKVHQTIKPLRSAKWQADFSWDRLERSLAKMGDDYGGLELDPDFQRGHVWTKAQQTHFIENCLRKVVTASELTLQFNCPLWSEDSAPGNLPHKFQCVDGLQRYTAITEFVRGYVHPFGFHVDELNGTNFTPRNFYVKIAVHDFTQRSDLLYHYLSINTGGTPHSPEEIERVRNLWRASKNELPS